GHNGAHTHKDQWRHAWDFVILNKEGSQYKKSGDFPEDYFCFGKPVIAPETGIVEKVVNDIDDNVIGEVNLQQNWGNTIVIKHDDGVYTKLSHLKKGSIKVEEGDKVQYGQIIAQCGNSGRSPYPHLHFQVQEFPYIGSVTKDYPISSYVLHQENSFSFCSYKKPQENEKVSNIEVNDLLKKAFHLTPGEVLKFKVTGFRDIEEIQWEVKVNPQNETYIFCSRSGAIAYFDRDENQFRFTYFEGEKNCLLYYFFVGCYNVQEGFYQDLVLKDNYPLSLVYPKTILWFHDFISPFIRLAKAEYEMEYVSIDDHISPSEIRLDSSLRNLFMKKELNRMKFHTTISKRGVQSLVVEHKGAITKLERCDD
ncbi:MAG: M23 family metallopeptidase, partial [Bacteroidales bacterium]|nr:M23 family metallopeptidase [Bacteroidales bacterium]